MSVLILLLIASLVLAGSFLGAFLWAVGRGQYDDTGTPALRMLHDDVTVEPSLSDNSKPNNNP